MPALKGSRRPYPACLLAVIAIVAAARLPLSASADEPAPTYTLRYRFAPGDSVHYVVVNKTQIEMQQGGVEQEIEHQETTDKHYAVVSTDDAGNGVLELTLDRAQMSVAVDGNPPSTFDSKSQAPPPAYFVGVAGTIGKPLARIQMTPQGEILSTEWLIGGRQQAGPQAEGDILVRLPADAVPVGGEWKERFETEVAVNETLKKTVTLLRTYRLVGVDGDQATIQFETAVITPLHDPDLEAKLIQKAPSGAIVFDFDRGVLLSRTSELDRRVVGFNGAKSQIRNITTRSERINEAAVPQAVKTAQESAPEPR